MFLGTIVMASSGAHDVYTTARERSSLLDSYEAASPSFLAMNPYEHRESSGVIADARHYGNDRIETTASLYSQEGNRRQVVSFSSLRVDPARSIEDYAGTALCTADFTRKGPVGSYQSVAQSNAEPTITRIALPISVSLLLTHLEIRNGIAYISVDSSVAADPDIFIIDITDPTNPFIRSSINTGPGIASFALAGNRIYAAAASAAAQLHIIKMNSLDSLALESRFSLPLPYATATPPYGSSIFFNKGFAYLGTEKWDGAEFSIIDVSDPSKPALRGGWETGGKIADIYVNNGIAYTASADALQIRSIDVRDASQPVLMDAASPSGWERQEGKALFYFEDALGLGRTSGGYNITHDPEALTWSSTSPLSSPIGSTDVPGGVYGMVADRSHIYAAVRQGTGQIRIYNRGLASTTARSYPLSVAPISATCDGSALYFIAGPPASIYKVTFI